MLGMTSVFALLIVMTGVCTANKIPLREGETSVATTTVPTATHQEESLCDINIFASHHKGVVAAILIFAIVGLVTLVVLVLCLLKHRCFCKDDSSRYRSERVEMNEVMWA